MTDTIRLSDRLELRPTRYGPGSSDLYVNGGFRGRYDGTDRDALIEACNPSRLTLPPGVHQVAGRFLLQREVAPLPEGWEAYRNGCWGTLGHDPVNQWWYEVRPTTANPLPTLPATCWQIPDGRICCLRKDAPALRDMGWTIHWTGDGSVLVGAADRSPELVVEARPPAKPDTEKVPLAEALLRHDAVFREAIVGVDLRRDQYRVSSVPEWIDCDGQVEVLR